jgi:hypothetical protein
LTFHFLNAGQQENRFRAGLHLTPCRVRTAQEKRPCRTVLEQNEIFPVDSGRPAFYLLS